LLIDRSTLADAGRGVRSWLTPTVRVTFDALTSLATSSSPGWVGRLAARPARVLIVEPDEPTRRAIQAVFARLGQEVGVAASVGEAVALAGPWHLVVAPPVLVDDLRSRGMGPILAHAGGELASLAGAITDERAALPGAADRLIGVSAALDELRATIERVAPHRSTVLIRGESGTGKELVARAVHDASGRRGRFVAVNCAAIPGPLLESELFGHKKGAFTDAHRDKPGLFEDADGGTLFLDEVGELPLPLQVKLLRAIQESEVRRVGDTVTVKVDVRVLAATLRDLEAEVRGGRFREDLYYRLNVLPVVIPPLRDRPEDVPVLVAAFAARHAERGGETRRFTGEAIALLQRGAWPGNVRQLENTVERAIVLADTAVIDAAFVAELLGGGAGPAGATDGDEDLSIKKATRSLEADLIRRALAQTGGNRTSAARLLEISHRALLYKIKAYGITTPTPATPSRN
jgi:two-component system response regulator AtoC